MKKKGKNSTAIALGRLSDNVDPTEIPHRYGTINAHYLQRLNSRESALIVVPHNRKHSIQRDFWGRDAYDTQTEKLVSVTTDAR